MRKTRSFSVRHSSGCLGGIAYELRIQHHSSRNESWTPPVNVYRCRDQVIVCVELAGVDRREIAIEAEPRLLRILGSRQPLEEAASECAPLQVFAIEIDQGFFHREIPLPLEIDPQRVVAEQRNGMLWIYLPLLS